MSNYFGVLCLFLCCFVCSAAHKQLLALFDLGSFISRVNKCSRVIFILKDVFAYGQSGTALTLSH